jgi:alpha-L-fucosidase
MRLVKLLSILFVGALFLRAVSSHAVAEERFEPNWESLKQYQVPEWFTDAKFGIFVHWGVYSVPAFDNEWYPRNMYLRRDGTEDETDVFTHHREKWGPQSKFGYKDFIPMFKAEKFSADDWAELFQKSGAKYVVPVAEHHDGFAMYDSSHTKWDAVEMGPKRDVIAELEKACRDRDLKFGVSSHYAFNWKYYTYGEDFDTNNPENAGLYSPAHPKDTPQSKEFLEHWYARTIELVDKFQPDVLWFDFCFDEKPFEPYRKKLAAYYYNKGQDWDKGVILQYKKDAYPEGAAMLDVERGKLAETRNLVWQTDTSVSSQSWGYVDNDQFKPVDELVDDLVDIVSKNGCLLLNVGPRADGTIPEQAVDRLLGVGEWLNVNGEAIYGTRPWKVYGEGPTEIIEGPMAEEKGRTPFTAQDIRFTKKGNHLYATALAWPADGKLLIKSLGKTSAPELKVKQIELLGGDKPLEFDVAEEAMTIQLPEAKPCDHAFVCKIELAAE